MVLSDFEQQASAETLELQRDLLRARAKQIAILQILARLDRHGLSVADLARHLGFDAAAERPATAMLPAVKFRVRENTRPMPRDLDRD